MDVLGGSIGATSCAGHGSIFWITFPLVKPQSKNKAAVPTATSWSHFAESDVSPVGDVGGSRPFARSLPARSCSSEISSSVNQRHRPDKTDRGEVCTSVTFFFTSI